MLSALRRSSSRLARRVAAQAFGVPRAGSAASVGRLRPTHRARRESRFHRAAFGDARCGRTPCPDGSDTFGALAEGGDFELWRIWILSLFAGRPSRADRPGETDATGVGRAIPVRPQRGRCFCLFARNEAKRPRRAGVGFGWRHLRLLSCNVAARRESARHVPRFRTSSPTVQSTSYALRHGVKARRRIIQYSYGCFEAATPRSARRARITFPQSAESQDFGASRRVIAMKLTEFFRKAFAGSGFRQWTMRPAGRPCDVMSHSIGVPDAFSPCPRPAGCSRARPR